MFIAVNQLYWKSDLDFFNNWNIQKITVPFIIWGVSKSNYTCDPNLISWMNEHKICAYKKIRNFVSPTSLKGQYSILYTVFLEVARLLITVIISKPSFLSNVGDRAKVIQALLKACLLRRNLALVTFNYLI